MGAGDAKFAAAMAPFVALQDVAIFAVLFASLLLAAFATHRLVRAVPQLRGLAPHWESWTAAIFRWGCHLRRLWWPIWRWSPQGRSPPDGLNCAYVSRASGVHITCIRWCAHGRARALNEVRRYRSEHTGHVGLSEAVRAANVSRRARSRRSRR
jgi:hypothetical protein